MKDWYAIGVMSGTSLDGIDMAYIKFSLSNEKYTYQIITAETLPYTSEWQTKLKKAFFSTAQEITELHIKYGELLGTSLLSFISKNNIQKLDFIASHGHTIFHQPEKGYTLQIGSGSIIAILVKKLVISDFRTQDVALGGQGAPLVPIGDQLLFSEYDSCINIGGFANISFDNNKGDRKAFDICPANILLNHYTNKVNIAYDDKGEIARSGKVNNDLLHSLSILKTYNHKKSMGYEMVLSTFFPLIDSYQLSLEDTLSTITEHIAQQITKSINPYSKILITGGGAYNSYLIENIRKHSSNTLIIPDKKLIEFKEALIFAFLGLLKLEKKINILSSVTGARKDHSAGVLHLCN